MNIEQFKKLVKLLPKNPCKAFLSLMYITLKEKLDSLTADIEKLEEKKHDT